MAKNGFFVAKPRGRFIKVLCVGCGNEQVIFGNATTKVNCLVCNQELAKTGASGIKVTAKIIGTFE
ncbi:MAG: 30S ribosomal protein S27e [archaeon]